MRLEDLALIGNCQLAALVENTGAIVWCCMPRFDAEPIFASLLDHESGGRFAISGVEQRTGSMRYLENTNVVETVFTDTDGAFRVLDFAPRFRRHGRSVRPVTIVRIVEPLSGTPRVRVACDPVLGWSKQAPARRASSNHVSYDGYAAELRVTTDVPLSYLSGQPFALSERRHFVLSWGEPVEESLPAHCEALLRETVRYWNDWVKHCDVPPFFQREVIRSALALKLHCYEDTGAIVAATTTSLPEFAGSGRTWDYRYCWLRDAYYSLGAFRHLGHFEEREQFLNYLLNVVAATPRLDLAPLYCIDGTRGPDERILEHWPGYGGEGPVRIGNAAALHTQNDIYGEMLLAFTPIFLDERFSHERTPTVLELMRRLAERAVSVVGQPDAGIWELRSEWEPQTFTSLMCWAAADRMAITASRVAPQLERDFRQHAERIRALIVADAWSSERDCFVATHRGSELDASLLQAITLRLLPSHDRRMHRTLDAITEALGDDGWLFRYRSHDGLGTPSVAFVVCAFWRIEALARLGRKSEAFSALEHVCKALGPLGLMAEDFDVRSGRMWGNFPQAYSHVGLINAAFAASPPWSEVL